MIKEFTDFVKRGNVIDLAVAVILGVAFGAIVTSLVDDIIMPLIGVLLGGINFASLSIQVGEAEILYGSFVQAIVNFLIIAFVIFLAVRAYNRLQKEEEEEGNVSDIEHDDRDEGEEDTLETNILTFLMATMSVYFLLLIATLFNTITLIKLYRRQKEKSKPTTQL